MAPRDEIYRICNYTGCFIEGVPKLLSGKQAGIDSKSAHSIERANSHVQTFQILLVYQNIRNRACPRIEWFKKFPRFKTPQCEIWKRPQWSVICSFTHRPTEPTPVMIYANTTNAEGKFLGHLRQKQDVTILWMSSQSLGYWAHWT